MKKIIIMFMVAVAMTTCTYAQSGSYNAALGALDTLTNTDTTTYVVSITGNKHTVGFQTDITKISGTVAGYVKVYGSKNGTTYETTPLIIDTIGNSSAVYGCSFNYNGYVKYKLQVTSSGTCSFSQTSWVLYRKE